MEELKSQLERLGLDPYDSPWMGFSAGALPRLLDQLRAMRPPVTWHDIEPTLPAEWPPKREEAGG